MKCYKCGLNNREYKVKSGSREGKIQSYCKQCNKQNVIERQRKLKQKCVEYCGNKCKICGYSKYIGALDFHHLDPNKKDIKFSRFGRTSWDNNKDKLTQELDKCILLCSNCHREVHGGFYPKYLNKC